MAIIRNDIGPISAKSSINLVLILFVLAAAIFLLWKQIRKIVAPSNVDAGLCKDDPNYAYKDPAKHPNDC
ncbi:MAG: hypothetical protein H7246_21790 [Phycisphaerae bacterium]|nr:hypothetical protein [Saprospiraceae bacterium]